MLTSGLTFRKRPVRTPSGSFATYTTAAVFVGFSITCTANQASTCLIDWCGIILKYCPPTLTVLPSDKSVPSLHTPTTREYKIQLIRPSYVSTPNSQILAFVTKPPLRVRRVHQVTDHPRGRRIQRILELSIT